MCVMENVYGRQEIIALAFWDDNSIGMFALEQNKLVSIKHVALEPTQTKINVSCWCVCVLRDETGDEHALARFDYKSGIIDFEFF